MNGQKNLSNTSRFRMTTEITESIIFVSLKIEKNAFPNEFPNFLHVFFSIMLP